MMLIRCNDCGAVAIARYTGYYWRTPVDWWVGIGKGREVHACSEDCASALKPATPGFLWKRIDKTMLLRYNRRRLLNGSK